MKDVFKKIYSLIFGTEDSSLSDILRNISWLILDKGINILAGIFVGVWVARYLGVEKYGQYNYALAYISLFAPLAILGLQDLIIRNIVRDPEREAEILSAGFTLQVIAGVLAFFSSIILAQSFFSEDTLFLSLVFILGIAFFVQPVSNIISYWFQSKLKSRNSVIARNWALLIVSFAKIGLILLGASLIAFAWTYTIQAFIFSAILVFFYLQEKKDMGTWQFKYEQVRTLIRDSWPLIISGFAVTLYMRFDQIMISNMIGLEENGIYSAAIRFSELWYFLPVALSDSVFPSIIRSRETYSKQIYNDRMQLFFDVVSFVTYLIVIPLAIFAPFITNLLYGAEYVGAGNILRVHIWSFLFVSSGVSRGRWLIAENMMLFSMLSTTLGAVANLGLNYVLIPLHGGVGAAWATLISYALSAYFSSILMKQGRNVFRQQSLALLLPLRMRVVGKSIREVLLTNE